jgi:hypothetical protein
VHAVFLEEANEAGGQDNAFRLGGDLEDGGVTSRIGRFSPHHSEKILSFPPQKHVPLRMPHLRDFFSKKKQRRMVQHE